MSRQPDLERRERFADALREGLPVVQAAKLAGYAPAYGFVIARQMRARDPGLPGGWAHTRHLTAADLPPAYHHAVDDVERVAVLLEMPDPPSLGRIAVTVGCSSDLVAKVARDRGVTRRLLRVGGRPDVERRARFVAALRGGLTPRHAAREAGYHPDSAHRLAAAIVAAENELAEIVSPARPFRRDLRALDLDPGAIRAARQKAGLSQAALAEQIGAAAADVVRRWEQGESAPSAVLLLRLMAALKLSPRALLTPRGLPERPVDAPQTR